MQTRKTSPVLFLRKEDFLGLLGDQGRELAWQQVFVNMDTVKQLTVANNQAAFIRESRESHVCNLCEREISQWARCACLISDLREDVGIQNHGLRVCVSCSCTYVVSASSIFVASGFCK